MAKSRTPVFFCSCQYEAQSMLTWSRLAEPAIPQAESSADRPARPAPTPPARKTARRGILRELRPGAAELSSDDPRGGSGDTGIAQRLAREILLLRGDVVVNVGQRESVFGVPRRDDLVARSKKISAIDVLG